MQPELVWKETLRWAGTAVFGVCGLAILGFGVTEFGSNPIGLAIALSLSAALSTIPFAAAYFLFSRQYRGLAQMAVALLGMAAGSLLIYLPRGTGLLSALSGMDQQGLASQAVSLLSTGSAAAVMLYVIRFLERRVNHIFHRPQRTDQS